jgi:hypothetical protein
MSEKNLLEESTIRRFMKLANIPAVKSDLLSEGKGAGQDPAGGRGFGVTRDEDRGNLGPNGQGYGKGGKKPSHGGAIKPKGKLKEVELDEEETVEEELELEAADDEGAAEMPAPEMGADMGGDDLGMGGDESTGEEEGGDIEADVEEIATRLTSILAKMGSSKEVAVEKEPEAQVDEEGYGGMPSSGEDEGAMMESDELEEELYESLEVDDDERLAEELTRRVAARLVAEMKKAKEQKGKGKGKKEEEKGKKKKVEEGKGAGNWLKKVAPAKKPTGHPVGTGKKATPFTKAAKKVGGLGGRGR